MKTLFQIFALVVILGFITSCKGPTGETANTGEEVEVSTASAEATAYNVNAEASAILWKGIKPTGTHNGTVKVSEGTLSVKDGSIESGKFTLDMNSITVLDLEGDYKTKLEGHLKGTEKEEADHFFNVKQYPTATFEISSVKPLLGDADFTHTILGNLKIKDKTHSIEFKANVKNEGGGLIAESNEFTIDRTKWGVNYGSKSIFDNLGDKFINDEIELKIQLSALQAPQG